MYERDFIDFKFGDHWASEFNLLTVSSSSGDRHSPPIFGNVNPNTTSVAGKVGVYKWKTQVGEKVFNINMAFDNINGQILNQIKEWLNPFKIEKLIFKEEPFKYYWASLNAAPQLNFLPFLTEEREVNGVTFQEGVYRGEFSLQFICCDNYGYSDWDSYNEEEGYVVNSSNLLDDSDYYSTHSIHKSSYFDEDSGNPSTSGITYSRPTYLYNAGNEAANLNLTFDLILPNNNSPLVILIKKIPLTASGWGTPILIGSFDLTYFSNFKPFVDIYDSVLANWQIEINSDLCEIYLKHKTDESKIISLNRFNTNHQFLKLAPAGYVDYTKPFPAAAASTVQDTAIENLYFNQVSVQQATENYRLKNVNVEWKHTYL